MLAACIGELRCQQKPQERRNSGEMEPKLGQEVGQRPKPRPKPRPRPVSPFSFPHLFSFCNKPVSNCWVLSHEDVMGLHEEAT